MRVMDAKQPTQLRRSRHAWLCRRFASFSTWRARTIRCADGSSAPTASASGLRDVGLLAALDAARVSCRAGERPEPSAD